METVSKKNNLSYTIQTSEDKNRPSPHPQEKTRNLHQMIELEIQRTSWGLIVHLPCIPCIPTQRCGGGRGGSPSIPSINSESCIILDPPQRLPVLIPLHCQFCLSRGLCSAPSL